MYTIIYFFSDTIKILRNFLNGSLDNLYIYFYIINFLFLINQNVFAKDKIILASDYRCPYVCELETDSPGYLVELTKNVFQIYNIAVEYKIMPWSDAIAAVESQEIDGIMGITNTDGKDLLIPHEPQAYSTIGVFGKDEIDYTYDNPSSLIGKKIAIVLDYELNNDSIDHYITTNYLKDPWAFNIESGRNAAMDALDSIADNAADLYIGDQNIVESYLKKSNFKIQIKNCGKITDDPIPIYIAFAGSKSNSKKYITMLEEGMASIKSTGQLRSLKEKYNIK